MYCRVFLNEDTYFDIIFLDGQIKIEDYGLGIASVIKVSYENGRIEVSVIGKKIGYFSLGEEKPHYYENAYTTVTEIRSYMQALVNQANGIDNSDQTNNVVMLRKGTTDVVYHSQTELHTHFIEMLNGEEFIKILFTMCPDVMDVPIGEDGHLIGYLGKDDKGNRLSVMDCVAGLVPVSSVAALKLAKELEMPMTSQGLFDDLSDAISKRNNLVDYVARRLQETMYPDETIGNIKARIYVALLKCSLELLKSQGIKYTEISYSNDSTIKKMLELLGEDASKYIDFSMLLSANRNSFQNPSYVSETKKNLRKLLDKGLVRGFDLMGEEKPLSVNDHNFNLETSLASFLDYVVPLLNKHDDTVLRLHMGENQNSYTNPIDSLQLIEEVPPKINIKGTMHCGVKVLS